LHAESRFNRKRFIQSVIAKPKPHSRKGDNGVLLAIGGSRHIHGAPLLAVRAAAKIVDIVYFHSPEKSNANLLRKMREKTALFIAVDRKGLQKTVEKSDCVLIGNGLEVNAQNRRLVNGLLKRHPQKRFVLDAGALRVADKRLLRNRIVAPHAGEFKALFGCEANGKNAKAMAAKWGCVVLLKKGGCFVTDGRRAYSNANGNAGMTKGGTGDVLAGLCAALYCRNAAFESAKAAAWVNGRAGDGAFKAQGYAFDAEDLLVFIPKALKAFGWR